MKNVNVMLEILFKGVQLRRWNGIYKAEEFVETTKQGLNAAIAYVLAKIHEEQTGENVNYSTLIELSICRIVYKTIFTDINPRISYRLLSELKEEANDFAIKQVKELGFDEEFCNMFADYMECKDKNDCVELQIFHAASKLATYWEFNQIKPGAGQNYLIQRMERDIKTSMEYIKSLEAVKDYMLDEKINSFIDLYANTAYIKRWARFEMWPQISDLAHMYMTAVVSYIMMMENGISNKRCIEGFYAGLFHDTIEILTGDLPYTLKKEISGLKARLTEIEKAEYNNYIKPLLPAYLNKSIEKFVLMKVSERDRKIVKMSDNISAYVEVVTSVLTGTTQDYFINIIERDWEEYKSCEVEGIPVKKVYEYFYDKYLEHQEK